MIYCKSIGNSLEGFTNYFIHSNCYSELMGEFNLDLNSELTKALGLNDWSEYSGNQLNDRQCCYCLGELNDQQPTP